MPLDRAEDARAEWIERFPQGFEERVVDGELELAAYGDESELPGARAEDVEAGWEDRWRDFHHGVVAGPFWIGPPWEQPPAGARAIVIDPGRAFGTGAHPTTRLCVELLAAVEPASVADVGCGSGVLGIAAALLGAFDVVCLDNDAAAIDATVRNAAANAVSVAASVLDVTTAKPPAAHVLVANISRELVEAVLAKAEAAIAITSGYLESDPVDAGPFVHVERHVLEGWAADLFTRAQ